MLIKAERVGTQSMVLSVGKEPCGQEEVPGQNRCTWASLTQGSIHNRGTDFSTLHSVKTECGAQPDLFWSGNMEDVCPIIQQPNHKANHFDLNAESKNVCNCTSIPHTSPWSITVPSPFRLCLLMVRLLRKSG